MAGGALTGVEVAGGGDPRRAGLTADALALLARLERDTRDRRGALLRRRLERQATFAAGMLPSFPSATQRLREGSFRVATKPPRVPVLSPPSAPCAFRLRDSAAFEPRVVVDGRPVSAALFDLVAAVEAFAASGHRAPGRVRLPAQESHLEARLWSELLRTVHEERALPAGALSAVIAVETLPALFELDEMVWELSPFAAALELDRTELARSTLEKLGDDPGRVAPDLATLLELHPAARATLLHVANVARRRGLAAWLAPTLPAPDLAALTDPVDGEAAARGAERLCEEYAAAAAAGFDALQLADPTHQELAERKFAALRAGASSSEAAVAAASMATAALTEELLLPAPGARTVAGVAATIAALLATEAAPPGSAPIRAAGQLETVASTALHRALLTQWLRHAAPLAEGGTVTPERVRAELAAQAVTAPLENAAERLAERLALPA
jgi:malate synthase